jgi:hypothetical protein
VDSGWDVVIVSTSADVHARAVQREVERRGGSCVILSNEGFPAERMLSYAFDGEAEDRTLGSVALSGAGRHAVWLRRFRPYTLDDKLHGEYRDYARSATDAAFEGILCGSARLTVNSPSRNRLVDHKPFQLQLARRCGLAIPRTLVTNDPEEARRFVLHHRRAVTKSIASWRFRLIESRLLEAGHLPDFSSITLCPVLLQEYVDGTVEYRVTVVGSRVFAAKVDLSDAPYPVDVRLHFSRAAQAADLPAGVEERLLQFHREAGLIYGAYDLRCDRNGVLHFLEVNPDGQYLFIEIETGLPISETLADLLLRPPGMQAPESPARLPT